MDEMDGQNQTKSSLTSLSSITSISLDKESAVNLDDFACYVSRVIAG